MSDLETYMFGICGSKSYTTWFEATDPASTEWEKHITVGATERIVILSLLFRFIVEEQSAAGRGASVDLCFSVGTDDTETEADANRNEFIYGIQECTQNGYFFCNFEGCPIIGTKGQHLHLRGHTINDDYKPTVIIQYLIMP